MSVCVPVNRPQSLWPARLTADVQARRFERYEPVTYRVMHRELGSALRHLVQTAQPETPGEVAQFDDLLRAFEGRGTDAADEQTEVRHSLWYLREWMTAADPQKCTPAMRDAFDGVRSAAFDLSCLHSLPSRKFMVRPAIWAVPNFFPVVPGVYRGGQPTQAGVDWLVAHGFRAEIDLRGSDRDNTWGDPVVWPSSVDRLSLPVEDMHCPTLEQVVTFKHFIDKPEHQPAIIHCKGGVGRTSALMACWSITQGLTADEALAVEQILPESLAQTQAIRQFEVDWKAWLAQHPEDAAAPGARERLLAVRHSMEGGDGRVPK